MGLGMLAQKLIIIFIKSHEPSTCENLAYGRKIGKDRRCTRPCAMNRWVIAKVKRLRKQIFNSRIVAALISTLLSNLQLRASKPQNSVPQCPWPHTKEGTNTKQWKAISNSATLSQVPYTKMLKAFLSLLVFIRAIATP
eukprot:6197068-Pleurochrysis_carterae.AAC.2